MKHKLVLLIAILAIVTGFAQAQTNCPPKTEIPEECKCYEVSKIIVCSRITKPFKLSKTYQLNTLSIENSPDLSDLADNVVPTTKKLAAKSLIIIQTQLSGPKLPTWQILQDVLSISTDKIKIMSDGTGLSTDTLDVEDLSPTISSLIVQGIPKLANFDPLKFTKLKRLEIIDTQLDEDLSNNLVLLSSNIKFLEFKNTNINGHFSIQPTSCNVGEQIIIKLRNNDKLSNFDFTLLNTDSKCSYHIELNDNKQMDTNLFTDAQIAAIDNFNKGTDKKLYLVMKNDRIFVCSCNLLKTYQKCEHYIHGILCKTNKIIKDADAKSLGALGKTDFKTDCV